MKRKKLKFKSLLNKYRSLAYEEEHADLILAEWGLEFEVYYRRYCAEKDIDINKLNKIHSKKVEEVFSSTAITPKTTSENFEEEFDSKTIFRQIAKKFHPDTLSADDDRRDEYEAAFKKATSAIQSGSWGELFDVADKYNLDLTEYEAINDSIRMDIERIQKRINKKKETYSWLLYQCEDDVGCKDNIVKKFLKHLFNI
tara:strand:+ start:3132 stop:3728 length:597 start_codon:yes stop_codon:yes gene_type:complete